MRNLKISKNRECFVRELFADCEWTLDFIRGVVFVAERSWQSKLHVRLIDWQRSSGITVAMEVTSEIYEETDFSSVAIASGSEFRVNIRSEQFQKHLFLDVISKFRFNLPADTKETAISVEQDDDSDLIVSRKRNECIEIGEIMSYVPKKSCWQGKIFCRTQKVDDLERSWVASLARRFSSQRLHTLQLR